MSEKSCVLCACLIVRIDFASRTKASNIPVILFCCFCLSVNSPPPALPPKKRQSAPSPTRVAVVAPMSRGSSLPCSVHRQVRDCSPLWGTFRFSLIPYQHNVQGINQPLRKRSAKSLFFSSVQQQDYEQEFLQRRFSGGSQSYGGDSPRLSPCSSMGKLSKSDEQLSSMEQDSGQCSRNTSCETLGKTTKTNRGLGFYSILSNLNLASNTLIYSQSILFNKLKLEMANIKDSV